MNELNEAHTIRQEYGEIQYQSGKCVEERRHYVKMSYSEVRYEKLYTGFTFSQFYAKVVKNNEKQNSSLEILSNLLTQYTTDLLFANSLIFSTINSFYK